MIIQSISPSRLSLFGGGTDFPEYYLNNGGGLVVNMAIDIYQRFTMYSGDDIYGIGRENNTVPEGGKLEFVYTVLKRFGINGMHHTYFKNTYDGIIESGLGSSAAAAVNIVSAISKRLNLGYDRLKIAETAWDIEVNDLGLFGGKQDQIASAFGGFNVIKFGDKIEIAPFSKREAEKILPALCILYIGKNRQSAVIQEGLKTLSATQIESLKHLKKLAYDSITYIYRGDIEKLGYLLDEAWEFKKKSNKGVTNPLIDRIYVKAKKYGAWGFKVCGAGGGGYIVCMVDPAKKAKFIQGMENEAKVQWRDFNICFNGVSSRIEKAGD